ncbi:MAG: MFS transporter [Dehalococcoidia bacterium]|nr:MFS transporter [Dehalococcoidia bacterium]MDW8119746.1 MFS transporter [Chloroflexota bacterium]
MLGVFRVSRRVVRATGGVAASLFGDSMLYAVLPAQMPAFGVSPAVVGLVLSVNRFVRLWSNGLAARVYLRFGLQVPFAMAIAVGALTTLLYGVIAGASAFLALRALWGVCYSFLRLGGYLVVLEESTPRNRGQVMGFFNGGQRAGSIVGALLGGILFDLLARERSFLVMGVLTALGLLLVGGLKKPSLPLGDDPLPSPSKPVPVRPISLRGIGGWFTGMLALDLRARSRDTHRRWLTLCIALFCLTFTMQGLLTATLGYYLRQRLGANFTVPVLGVGIASVSAGFLAVRWVVDLLGPGLGALADRWGRRRTITVCLPLLAAGMLALAWVHPVGVALAFLPLVFLTATACQVCLDALAGNFAPRDLRPMLLGRYTTWADLGAAAGPLLGYLGLVRASLPLLYSAAAVLLLVGVGLFASSAFRPEPAAVVRQPRSPAAPSP